MKHIPASAMPIPACAILVRCGGFSGEELCRSLPDTAAAIAHKSRFPGKPATVVSGLTVCACGYPGRGG